MGRPPSLQPVLRILAFWKRHDLVRMLRRARLDFDVSNTYGSRLFSLLTVAEIYTPIEDSQQLRALSADDRGVILQALLEIYPPKDNDIEITAVDFLVDPEAATAYATTDDELLEEINAQRNMMIQVATGGSQIQAVNAQYKERREGIRASLKERGLQDPNPYSDLWDWYAKWSSGDLPTYQSRRHYIRELYQPLVERLSQGPGMIAPGPLREPTGWARVDRGLDKVRKQLERAENEEDFQTVGLYCRETLISLAQAVYDPEIHLLVGGPKPSQTDAKGMLTPYIETELAGGSNEAARKHAKASLDLANDLQHRRTATFRDAAMCAEATTSVVNLIAIVSGRRDPEGRS